MNYSSSIGSSVHGVLQATILRWVAFPSPGDLPDPGNKCGSPAFWAYSIPLEPPPGTGIKHGSGEGPEGQRAHELHETGVSSSLYWAGLRRPPQCPLVHWKQELAFHGVIDERAMRDSIVVLWGCPFGLGNCRWTWHFPTPECG